VSFRVAFFVSAASGFVALSYEILWFRFYSFVTEGMAVAFGALLGFYLLGVAFGSLGSRAYCQGGDAQRAKHALEVCLVVGNVLGFLVGPVVGFFASWTNYWWSLLFVMMTTTLTGAVLPLVSHLAIPANDHSGARLSYLYVANILGSCAGSLITGFVLLDYLPTRSAGTLISAMGLVLAVVVGIPGMGRSRRSIAALLAVTVCLGAMPFVSHALYDSLYPRLEYKKDYTDGRSFVEMVENRSGVIHVNEYGQVYGGGAYDGAFSTGLSPDKNIIARAYAVSLMHPRPKMMLMVGLASGSWARVLGSAPGVEDFTVVEINPGYLELIERHDEVCSILHDPKIHIVIDDGRRWLEAHPGDKFDAIVMNTTWHWRAHATNLLSIEFMHLVQQHLLPGGLFFFNTTESLDACKTLLTAFPHGLRIVNFMAGSDAPLAVDPKGWEPLLDQYRIDGKPVLDGDRDVRASLIRNLEWNYGGRGPEDKVTREDDLRVSCATGGVITDDNMLTEWKGKTEE
jgi:spermidine synthase